MWDSLKFQNYGKPLQIWDCSKVSASNKLYELVGQLKCFNNIALKI